jgi:hypothetical protein
MSGASHLLLLGLLLRLFGAGRAPRIGVGHGAVRLCAAGKGGRGGQHQRPVEFGDQRAARVGADGGDRSRSRPHAEAMKRQHRIGLCGIAHGERPILSRLPVAPC